MRLLTLFCSIAAFSTVLALAVQDRSLSEDLENAARARLSNAGTAAERLLDLHVEATGSRYRAVSETPQLRANLDSGHRPTLVFHAEELRRKQAASLIAFRDAAGEDMAHAGSPSLAEATRGAQGATLLLHDDGLYLAVAIPLVTGARALGSVLAVEPIDASLMHDWSQLCGATVLLEARGSERNDDLLVHPIRRLGNHELRVATSLAPERAALTRSRLGLLAAGFGALLAAALTGAVAAHRFVVPIRRIQRLAERITQRDFSKRLHMERSDEIGDVARAFDAMLERLARTQGRLANAQRFARLGNWAIEIDTAELSGSDEFRRILQLEGTTRPIRRALLVARAHPEDRAGLQEALEACLQEGRAFALDHRILLPGGEERVLHTRGARVSDAGQALRVEGTIQDITERKRIEDEVRYLAYHDMLTGLGSRRLFEERLDLALRARPRDHSIGVMFVDLDHFKIINDTLGHGQGDRLLRSVAARLVACAANYETQAGAQGTTLVTRQGGDEFTLLVDRVAGREPLRALATDILGALRPSFDLEGHQVSITGSIGIALCPDDGQSSGDLLRSSDTAMYQAKREGRDRVQFYTEEMQEAAFRRLHLESQLRRALERDEFEVYYQPRVDSETGRVAAVEALLRWRDSENRMLGPAEFVPLAEETGLIRPIGEWVLRRAIADAQSWPGDEPLRISVNLSFHQVDDDSFVDTVASVLTETQFDPDLLELEITESALMRDEVRAIEVLTELKQQGVQLSLDDFGTGFSSLSHLRILPIDTVKIDRSFVRRVATEADDNALVSAIVSMAKVLRLSVTAEGVEDEEQRECLTELGCDELQGFLFSSPLPAPQVPAVVAQIAAAAKRAAERSEPSENSVSDSDAGDGPPTG
jgi:diguanylate cyclase (GGDEF)-like protein